MDAEQFRHKCGTHFSGGPVEVGLVTIDNVPTYSCGECVAKRAAEVVQEAADKQAEFVERWVV